MTRRTFITPFDAFVASPIPGPHQSGPHQIASRNQRSGSFVVACLVAKSKLRHGSTGLGR
jgi:hypothetical protein